MTKHDIFHRSVVYIFYFLSSSQYSTEGWRPPIVSFQFQLKVENKDVASFFEYSAQNYDVAQFFPLRRSIEELFQPRASADNCSHVNRIFIYLLQNGCPPAAHHTCIAHETLLGTCSLQPLTPTRFIRPLPTTNSSHTRHSTPHFLVTFLWTCMYFFF